jgi:hypothetical protein
MLLTDWTDHKDEDASPDDDLPPASGVESTPCPTAPGNSSAAERNIPPESKHIFQARAQAPTPPDRQRTAQACDKCRERKTKASTSRTV